MRKRTHACKAGAFAAATVMVLGLSLGSMAETATSYSDNTGKKHANKYGVQRSTTHEQRVAAANRKAALMAKVKTMRDATGTIKKDSTVPTPGKPPATHPINKTN